MSIRSNHSCLRFAIASCVLVSFGFAQSVPAPLVKSGNLEEISAIHEKLMRLRLPPIELVNASFAEALEKIQSFIKTTDAKAGEPVGQGIKVDVEIKTPRPSIPITLHLGSGPPADALQQLTKATSMALRVEEQRVVIVQRDEGKNSFHTRYIQATPGIFELPREPHRDPFAFSILDMDLSPASPPGFWMVGDPNSGCMLIHGTEEHLDLAEGSVTQLGSEGPHKPRLRHVTLSMYLVSDTRPEATMDTDTAWKLRHWELPPFEISNVSLEEAVELLRGKIRAIDPDKNGLDIVVEEPIAKNWPITFMGGKEPLARSLLYLAELAGRRPILRGNQIQLVTKSRFSDERCTAVYRVPRNFLSLAREQGGSAKDILLSQGISLSPPSSVGHDATNHQLKVTSNMSDLEIVDLFLESVWRESDDPLPPTAASPPLSGK